MIFKVFIFLSSVTLALAVNKVPLPGRLYSWQCLHLGESIFSPKGCYELKLQDDGNLVIQSRFFSHPVWAAGTHNKNAYRVCMQGDGNLVIENRSYRPVWAAGSFNHPGARVIMQDDGNLVIYEYASNQHLWSSQTSGSSC